MNAFLRGPLDNGYGPDIWVMDTTNEVLRTIRMDFDAQIAVASDGKCAYAMHSLGPLRYVTVIDTATSTVAATIDIGGWWDPQSIAIAPDGKHAFVDDSRTLLVIDTATKLVPARVDLTKDADATNEGAASDTASTPPVDRTPSEPARRPRPRAQRP